MRPIILDIGALTFNVIKWLTKEFKILPRLPSFSIKIFLKFIKKVKDVLL